MGLVLIYITNPDKKTAKEISKKLLKKKLIACANIFPIKSLFMWNGKIEKENEFVLLCKTISSKTTAVKKQVKKMHPYEVPCIIKWNASANKEYEKWVSKTLKINKN
jgi:periplasmic divalent cation tolerance protein